MSSVNDCGDERDEVDIDELAMDVDMDECALNGEGSIENGCECGSETSAVIKKCGVGWGLSAIVCARVGTISKQTQATSRAYN